MTSRTKESILTVAEPFSQLPVALRMPADLSEPHLDSRASEAVGMSKALRGGEAWGKVAFGVSHTHHVRSSTVHVQHNPTLLHPLTPQGV